LVSTLQLSPKDLERDRNGDGVKRVLVADDDEMIRSVVADLLEFEGYMLEVAANGAEALDRIRRAPPDAIVLDLMMPVVDGWQVAEAWREIRGVRRRPSSWCRRHMGWTRLPSGCAPRACGRYRQPFDLEALVGVIERYVPPAA
jgi:DNA-binding NtrC family response regulator